MSIPNNNLYPNEQNSRINTGRRNLFSSWSKNSLRTWRKPSTKTSKTKGSYLLSKNFANRLLGANPKSPKKRNEAHTHYSNINSTVNLHPSKPKMRPNLFSKKLKNASFICGMPSNTIHVQPKIRTSLKRKSSQKSAVWLSKLLFRVC